MPNSAIEVHCIFSDGGCNIAGIVAEAFRLYLCYALQEQQCAGN